MACDGENTIKTVVENSSVSDAITVGIVVQHGSAVGGSLHRSSGASLSFALTFRWKILFEIVSVISVVYW